MGTDPLGGVVINGIVYGVPSRSNEVLVFNPTTNTVSVSGQIPSSIDGTGRLWAGGVALSGVLYAIPHDANQILIYDPATNEVSETAKIPGSIDAGDKQWWGGVVVNAIVYGIPYNSGYVLSYNPATNEMSRSRRVPISKFKPVWSLASRHTAPRLCPVCTRTGNSVHSGEI